MNDERESSEPGPAGTPADAGAAAPADTPGSRQVAGTGPDALRGEVVEALKDIYDPEIPVNIYDLGLVYRVDVSDDGQVSIEMTLTAPGCPVAQTFPGWVESAVESVPGVTEARVELVWEPPWTMEQMSEEAKLQLGLL